MDKKLSLDTVTAERLLFSAQELAQANNLSICGGVVPTTLLGPTPISSDVAERRPSTPGDATDCGEEQLLTLHPPFANWAPFDQLAIPLFIEAGAGGRIKVEVHMKTRTPGIELPDHVYLHYPLGTKARDSWSGWRLLEVPYENFLVHGIPAGWTEVDRLVIAVTANGTVRLGDIILQLRERALGPRLTDAGLLGELDLSYPGLEAAAEAKKKGDLQLATTEVAQYFRQRTNVRHPFGRLNEEEKPYDTSVADQICRHFILGEQLGEEVDWRANPIGYLEWMHALNRHRFLNELTNAHLWTQDAKYARELEYLITSWAKANPEPIGNNGGGDAAWETLSTAARIYGAWLHAFFAMISTPAFSDEALVTMLKSFCGHAEHLSARSTTNSNNWLIVESRMLAIVGMLFPEFHRGQAWREAGMARLVEEIQEQVFTEGVQHELSPSYHIMSGEGFAQPYEIALLNGYEFPPIYKERLAGMFNFILYLSRPDRKLPALNDSKSSIERTAAWLKKGARMFDRRDMEWVATGGQKGEKPPHTSYAFLDSGLYVMRSGWQKDAHYLVFDGGPYGANHQTRIS